jgi:UDP-GlcNAc:undecaprenyl-phosphate/decaprenyl-phosphate GlcNAc-1-phosphate transferase
MTSWQLNSISGNNMHWMQGFILTAVLSWAAIRYLGPLGLMDIPQGRRQHGVPVARTGGLAFFAAALAGWALGWLPVPFSWPQCLGILGLGFLGFCDDRCSLRASWKALGGLALALAVAYPASALLAAAPGNLQVLGLPLPHSQLVYFGLLTIMYWSIPHAFNLIDGANGLALGYGILVLLVLAWQGAPNTFLLGSLLGLLAFNWPRSRHFLGDCGSLSLGLLLPLLATNTFGSQNPDAILWLFAYPILDVSMVVAIRLFRGQSPALGDRSHLHFQWPDRFPALRKAVVPFLWLNAGACALGAVATGGWRLLPWLGLASFGLQALVFWTLAMREHRKALESVPKRDKDFSPANRPISRPQEAS